MAHRLDRLVDGVLSADDGDEIVLVQPVVVLRPGDRTLLTPAQTREPQLSRDGLDDVTQERAVLALHPDGAVDERGGSVLVAAPVAQRQQTEEQHADDTVEVGDGIGDGGVTRSGLVSGHGGGVTGCGQGGCVRDGTGEGPGDHRCLESEETSHAHGGQGRHTQNAQEEGQRPAGGSDDVEEVRPGLDADGEGEDRQPQGSQLLGNLNGGGGCRPPGRQRNAAEQHRRCSEADSLDLDVPEQHPGADQDEQDEHHVPGQVVEDVGVSNLPDQQGGTADQEGRCRDAYAPAPGSPEQHSGANHEQDDDNRVVQQVIQDRSHVASSAFRIAAESDAADVLSGVTATLCHLRRR